MITTRTDFAYHIDRWDPSGNEVQRVADVDDLSVALATYEAACERWPGIKMFTPFTSLPLLPSLANDI